MASSPINVVVTLFPAPGKIDRAVELLNSVSKYINSSEPGTLRYEITREVNKKSGGEEIIMFESYKDQAAIAAHSSSSEFKKFQKTAKVEGLFAKPMQIKQVSSVGGFVSRL